MCLFSNHHFSHSAQNKQCKHITWFQITGLQFRLQSILVLHCLKILNFLRRKGLLILILIVHCRCHHYMSLWSQNSIVCLGSMIQGGRCEFDFGQEQEIFLFSCSSRSSMWPPTGWVLRAFGSEGTRELSQPLTTTQYQG